MRVVSGQCRRCILLLGHLQSWNHSHGLLRILNTALGWRRRRNIAIVASCVWLSIKITIALVAIISISQLVNQKLLILLECLSWLDHWFARDCIEAQSRLHNHYRLSDGGEASNLGKALLKIHCARIHGLLEVLQRTQRLLLELLCRSIVLGVKLEQAFTGACCILLLFTVSDGGGDECIFGGDNVPAS